MLKSVDEILKNPQVQEEYKKAVLLAMFKKIIAKEIKIDSYRIHNQKLFAESYDRVNTVKILIKREFGIDLSDEEATVVNQWFIANRNKKPRRRPPTLDLKKELCKKQGNRCASCGEDLGDNYSSKHVDHIIPWVLVGDELVDNFQILCGTCNECKNARTDYIIGKLLNII